MTTMRGIFYPRGHMVMMFPTEEDALRAARLLREDGVSEDDLSLQSSEEFERQIRDLCVAISDLLLPSVGTESDTAMHFRDLAHEGYYALFVHASDKLTSDHVVELLKAPHCSY